jgi:hypothetical protein
MGQAYQDCHFPRLMSYCRDMAQTTWFIDWIFGVGLGGLKVVAISTSSTRNFGHGITMSSIMLIVTSQLENHSMLLYVLLAALTVCIIHYAVLTARYNRAVHNPSHQKAPPFLPIYFLLSATYHGSFYGTQSSSSLLGTLLPTPPQHLTLTDPSSYALLKHPFRARLFGKDFYIIQGREHVLAHLAQTSTSNTIFNASFLRHACAMSDRAVERLGSENEQTPKYFERNYLAAAPLYAWSSSVIHRYLMGRSAVQLSKRFERNLISRIRQHEALTSPDVVEMPDFATFFTHDVTAALLDAMCGPGLLARNPTFTAAFHTFCDNLPTFMKRTPRFMVRRAYEARDEVLEGVADWQAWASEHFDENTTAVDENGDDEYWGSEFFRERFSTFVYEMGIDKRDMASMELGFLFGYVNPPYIHTCILV